MVSGQPRNESRGAAVAHFSQLFGASATSRSIVTSPTEVSKRTLMAARTDVDRGHATVAGAVEIGRAVNV